MGEELEAAHPHCGRCPPGEGLARGGDCLLSVLRLTP